MKLAYVVLAVVATSVSPSLAQDVGSANFVIVGCREFNASSRKEEFRQGYCAGIASALMLTSRGLGENIRSCLPKGVDLGQAVRVISTYIDQRPARSHETFAVLAAEAFHAAWPCKQ